MGDDVAHVLHLAEYRALGQETALFSTIDDIQQCALGFEFHSIQTTEHLVDQQIYSPGETTGKGLYTHKFVSVAPFKSSGSLATC